MANNFGLKFVIEEEWEFKKALRNINRSFNGSSLKK